MRVLALLLLLPPMAAHAADTIEPRPFGYTVGDVLERTVVLDPARDGMVDETSLPKTGRIGRWFALRAVHARPDSVRLVYQVVNSPEQSSRENLPSLRLDATLAGGQPHPIDIEPYTVSLSPVAIGSLGGSADQGAPLLAMRPDLEPPPVDVRPRRQRVAALGIALAALLAALWGAPLARRLLARRSGPFMRAWRALRRLPAGPTPAQANLAALQRLHAALDEAAGATLALDNVERLFTARPQLAGARADIEALLAASRAAFFGGAEAPARQQTLALARRLAELDVPEAA